MKRYLLLFISCVFVFGTWASPIDKSKAYSKAVAFMAGRGISMPKEHKMAYAGPSTATSTETASYYVFDVGNDKGFVIVAGDDVFSEVLGYTDSGSFDSDKLPENAKAMLESYAEQIEIVQKYPSLMATSTSTHAAISPLVQAEWDQSEPYNYLCPTVASESSRSVTGCVATAMAQVMYYHKWPEATTAVIPAYSYEYDSSTKVNVDAQAITTFDWDSMQTTYTGSESEDDASAVAVAQLMICAGKSVQMQYSNYTSGAYSSYIIPALKNYFDYDAGMKTISRGDYTTDEWDQLIYDELASSRPVLISATAVSSSGSGGHEFVCDGYDGSGLYHINWGWSGYCNGYFRLALLNPDGEGTGGVEGGGGYSLDQEVIIGIQPNQGNEEAVESTVLTAYTLEATSTSVTRANTSSNFSTKVNFESYNMTGSTATFDIAFGIYDASGNLKETVNIESDEELECFYGYNETRWTFQFGSGLSDGTYYIKLVSRISGDTEWHLQNSANLYYIVATISGNTASFENISANSELTIDEVNINGNKRATSTQKIAVSLTNSGTANTNELYAFVDGSLLGGIGVNIDPETSADYQFSWTPSKAGTYTISLASDMSSRDVLYTTTVTINNSIASSLSATFEVDNAIDNVIYGTTFSGTATISNDALAQYYDDVYVCLWYDGGDGYIYMTDYDTYFVQIAGGSSYDQTFSFTNLDVNTKYVVSVMYKSQGENVYNEDGLYSDEYSLSTTTGIQSVNVDADTDADGPVYDLNGVRVSDGAQLSNKIYIKGGKKFVGK